VKKIVLILLLLLPGVLYAESFNIKGYEISLSASRSNDTVTVSGKIRGGPKCETLTLDIFITNELGNIANTKITINKAGGYGSKLIEGSDALIIGRGNNWNVSNIFVNCISEKGY
jgi:hypothetical protein